MMLPNISCDLLFVFFKVYIKGNLWRSKRTVKGYLINRAAAYNMKHNRLPSHLFSRRSPVEPDTPCESPDHIFDTDSPG